MEQLIDDLLRINEFEELSGFFNNLSSEAWLDARLEAQLHGIAPLLYSRYKDMEALELPDPVLGNYLKSQYELNSKRIQRIQNIMYSVFLASDQSGITVMPLKGAVLINEYYKNPALRPMADIDLLVHETDVNRMEEVLETIGYYLREVTQQHRLYMSNSHISSMIGEHPDNPVSIEIHTRVHSIIGFEQYDITKYIWQSAEKGFLDFTSVMKPSAYMLLMHLFFHASNNQYASTLRAIQLYDIAILTKKITMEEWEKLLKISEALNCEKLIYAPLALAGLYFKIPIPDFVINRVNLNTPNNIKNLMVTNSLNDYIIVNELETIRHLARTIENTYYKKMLIFSNLLLLRVYHNSIQLKWHEPGKKKIHAILHLMIPPLSRIERYGYLIGYIWTYLTSFLTLTTNQAWVKRLRIKYLNRLKLLVRTNN